MNRECLRISEFLKRNQKTCRNHRKIQGNWSIHFFTNTLSMRRSFRFGFDSQTKRRFPDKTISVKFSTTPVVRENFDTVRRLCWENTKWQNDCSTSHWRYYLWALHKVIDHYARQLQRMFLMHCCVNRMKCAVTLNPLKKDGEAETNFTIRNFLIEMVKEQTRKNLHKGSSQQPDVRKNKSGN